MIVPKFNGVLSTWAMEITRFLQSLVSKIEANDLPSYKISALPDAERNARKFIYVSDETGGPVPAYSDGTNWRRFSDGAIVS